MAQVRWWSSALAAALALAQPAGVAAQDKQLYRYTDADGKVVYSDQPPPPSARNVQPKRVGTNVIETSEVPLAARIASEKFPVTLYTFKCGEPCDAAEALLNKRGVPYTKVDVGEPPGAAKLMAITGNNLAPVMQIGEKMIAKGMNEPQWQAMLDEVGYPRAPAPKLLPPGKGTEAPPVAKAAGAGAPPPAASGTAAEAAAAPAQDSASTAGGGYPK